MPEDSERDFDRALMTIKILAASFTDLAVAFTAADRKAAETAIAGIESDAAEGLRNIWREDARELRGIGDIDALLKPVTERALDRTPEVQKALEGELAENRRAMEEFNGLVVKPNPAVPVGTQSLLKRGRVVWTGALGAPIEDAECDEIQLNPEDYRRLLEAKPQRL